MEKFVKWFREQHLLILLVIISFGSLWNLSTVKLSGTLLSESLMGGG
jgi:hypothetical protein